MMAIKQTKRTLRPQNETLYAKRSLGYPGVFPSEPAMRIAKKQYNSSNKAMINTIHKSRLFIETRK